MSIQFNVMYFKYKTYGGYPPESTLMFNEIYLTIFVTEGLCTNDLDVSKLYEQTDNKKSFFLTKRAKTAENCNLSVIATLCTETTLSPSSTFLSEISKIVKS